MLLTAPAPSLFRLALSPQLFFRVFLIAACAALSACGDTHEPKVAQAAKQPATQFTATEENLKYIKVEEVRRTSGGSTIALNGRVTFDESRTAQIGSPVEGRVIQVLAKPGDRVQYGQTLLMIHSQNFTLVESAEQKARSTLRVAEKNFARAQRLFAEGAASQREVTEAEDALAQARAEYERALADLATLGGNQERSSPEFLLRSPINGVVTKGDKFYVYVEDEEKAHAYSPREVTLGPEIGSLVPVVKGLQGGERIVVEGAVLLDSALHKLL